ncbi:MAG: hypothetical protein R3A52_07120 [Polyangiales bacterium]
MQKRKAGRELDKRTWDEFPSPQKEPRRGEPARPLRLAVVE